MKGFVAVLSVYLLLSGCSGLSSEQAKTSDAALDALQKLDASTQVGVTYIQYGQMVIDAKAQVNKAVSSLPDGDLKTELNETIDSFTDARKAWESKIQDGGMLYSKSGNGISLIEKYNLPASSSGTDILGKQVNADAAMQVIWLFAKNHLERATAFRNGNSPPAPMKDTWSEARSTANENKN